MQFVVTMKRVKLSAIHKSSASSIYFTTFITLLLVCPEKCSMQEYPPQSFASEPQSQNKVPEGSLKIVSCQASCNPRADYRWMKDGTYITEFNTTFYSYRIQSVTRADTGNYRCVAKNYLGAIRSEGTDIIVAYLEDFELHANQNLDVRSGEGVLINLPSINAVPEPDVSWYVSGVPMSRVALNHQITLQNNLILLSTSIQHNGKIYKAEAFNTYNGIRRTSREFVLRVADTGEGTTVLPTLLVSPRNTTVKKGEPKAELECIYNARPLSGLQTKWYKIGSQRTEIVANNKYIFDSSYKRVLIIKDPALYDVGQYECEAVFSNNGQSSTKTSVAYITVYEAPLISSQIQSQYDRDYGQSVQVDCVATGNPLPTITWYFNSDPVSSIANNRLSVTSAGSLVINNLDLSDSGMYQCFATNDAGETKKSTWIKVDKSPPAFINLPLNLTLVEGVDARFPCEVSGAPKPVIIWQKKKDNVESEVITGGRYQIQPQTGELLIITTEPSDSALFFCNASNSQGSISAEAYLNVYQRTQITHPPLTTTEAIKGSVASLQCGVSHDVNVNITWKWYQDNVELTASDRITIEQDGTLKILGVYSGDNGLYKCQVISAGGNDERTTTLKVIELPYQPVITSVSVPQTALKSANISFTPGPNGNTPIERFIFQKRMVTYYPDKGVTMGPEEGWETYPQDVLPTAHFFVMPNLRPARYFQFRISSVNKLGEGPPSTAKPDIPLLMPEQPPEEAPRGFYGSPRSNSSIMLNWQAPPEDTWNGDLLGYKIKYRLKGYTSPFSERNTGAWPTTSFELTGLIVFTEYEIKIAAFNKKGDGVYSDSIFVRTREGIPGAAPTEVNITSVNSTAIKIIWLPPDASKINGVNLGYRILAKGPGNIQEMKTVPPDPNDPYNYQNAYLYNLHKFTEYTITVTCYTGQGQGPASIPLHIKTEEDVPGEVVSLSFSDIFDTSVKVMWQPPTEINGILTGYTLLWEKKSQTASRKDINLSNTTLTYTVRDLDPTTKYTIYIYGKTSKGPGKMSSADFESGVPPERPGTPYNLGISDIQARSTLLQFLLGYDGKTSITLWKIEGQIDNNSTWVPVYEISDPDARTILVPNLRPFTNYRLRITAVNIVGPSNYSAPSRKFQTAQAPPNIPPDNVTVRAINSTALRISWAPLSQLNWNGYPRGYEILYKRKDETDFHKVILDTDSESYTLTKLEEWMQYEVKMNAFNDVGWSPYSPISMERTRDAKPSAGPDNVGAIAVSSTAINVTWGDVPLYQRNGIILGYRVVYEPVTENIKAHLEDVPGNETYSVLLTDLRKYVEYQIKVLAYTRMGDGILSVPVIIVQTHEDVPGPPTKIWFPEVTYSTAKVVWEPPTQPNGILTGFLVSYKEKNGNIQGNSSELPVAQREYTVATLQREKYYTFKVMAKTRLGWGQPKEVLVYTIINRNKPDKPIKPQITSEVQARNVTISWQPAYDGYGPIRNYTIQYKSEGKMWTDFVESIPPSSSSYAVTGLHPNTRYNFRVAATNDIGTSNYSNPSDEVRTRQDIPEGAPQNLEVKPLTTDSIHVTWEHPDPSTWNGAILGYLVQYRKTDMTSYQEKSVQYPTHDYTLNDLVKYVNYEVKIIAFNSIGEGPASTITSVYVGEAAPSAAPVNIHTEAQNSTQIKVLWDPPPLETHNGDLSGYKVAYWLKSADPSTAQLVIVREKQALLNNLHTYTMYAITVQAYNLAGEGPKSAAVYNRTKEGIPGIPGSIEFLNVTMTTVNVTWSQPLQPNGVIQAYKLTYRQQQSGNGSSLTQLTIPGSREYVLIDKLEEGRSYDFSVKAVTSIGPGIETKKSIIMGPQPGSPGKPGKPKAFIEGSNVVIRWTNGTKGKGHIMAYYIQANNIAGRVKDWTTVYVQYSNVTSAKLPWPNKCKESGCQFRIVAFNIRGISPDSDPTEWINTTTVEPTTMPEEPTTEPTTMPEESTTISPPTTTTVTTTTTMIPTVKPCPNNRLNRTDMVLGKECGQYGVDGRCTVLHSACMQSKTDTSWKCRCSQGYAKQNQQCVAMPIKLFSSGQPVMVTVQESATSGFTIKSINFDEVSGFDVSNPTAEIKGPESSLFTETASTTDVTLKLGGSLDQLNYVIFITVSVTIDNVLIRDFVEVRISVSSQGIIEKNIVILHGTPKGSIIGQICTSCITGSDVISVSNSDVYDVNMEGSVFTTKPINLDTLQSTMTILFSTYILVYKNTNLIANVTIIVIRSQYNVTLDENSGSNTQVALLNDIFHTFEIDTDGLGTSGDVINLGSTILNYEEQTEVTKTLSFSNPTSIMDPLDVLVTIKIQDVNDVSPQFQQKPYNFLTFQSWHQNLIVGVVKADDPDMSSMLTYSITPNDILSIDEQGVIKADQAIPRSNYTAMVTVSDGRNFDTVAIVVNLLLPTNTNLQLEFTGTILENENPDTMIKNVSINGYKNYRFTDQAAYNDLHLDSVTGLVKSFRPFNRENVQERQFKITIVGNRENEVSCSLVIIGEITVNVIDVNDEPPVFINTPYTATVVEESSEEQLKMNLPMDTTDKDVNPTVSYSLVNHQDKFDINSLSGIIKTKVNISRETTPSLSISVKAYDGVNSATAVIVVTIEDRNNNPPSFTSTAYNFAVDENSQFGKSVGTISASDSDIGKNAEITYQIHSDGGYFRINQATGEITISRNLDREMNPTHKPIVYARDNGDNILSSSVTVTISVNDINDNAPLFSSDRIMVEFEENKDCSNIITNLTATDSDRPNSANSRITYSLLSGSDNFQIDPSTGSLKCQTMLNYENITSYTLLVKAQDNGSPAKLSSNKTVIINVKDINDNTPTFVKAKNSMTIRYFSTVQRVIEVLNVVDLDYGANGMVTFTISGSAAAFLTINNKGILKTKASSKPSDGSYNLTITATDMGSPTLSSSHSMTVTVNQVSTQPIKFLEQEIDMNITENSNIGTEIRTIFTKVEKPSDTTVTFEIIDEKADIKFSLNSDDGKVTLKGSIDREENEMHEFVVRVKNKDNDTQSDLALVTVQILDENDNKPIFDRENFYFEIREDSLSDTIVNPTGVKVIATDADIGMNAEIKYTQLESGGCPDVFTFKENSIVLTGTIDYELNKFCKLTVKAYNPNNETMSSTVNVHINVLDVNDNPPEFHGHTNNVYIVSVREDITINTEIPAFGMLEDKDSRENGDIELSTVSSCLFDVRRNYDKIQLQVKPSTTLNYESSINVYTCIIKAIDKGAPPLNATATLSISITDVNDNRPNITSPNTNVNVSRDAKVGHVIISQIHATDADSSENGELRYSLQNSQYYSKFIIDPATGRIAINSPLRSVQTDKITLMAIVSDKGIPPLSSAVVVTILITDDNPRPYLEQTPVINIQEHTQRPNDGEIVRVKAYDGVNANGVVKVCDCRFRLDTNRDDLKIDNDSGIVRFKNKDDSFDREKESNSKVFVSVIASDKYDPPKDSDPMIITINILDINDQYPRFTQDIYHFKVYQKAPNGVQIGTVIAIDKDLAPDTRYSINITESSFSSSVVSINETTGEITKSGDMTLNQTSNTQIKGWVYAQDNKDLSKQPPDSKQITITIEFDDKNNHTPTFQLEKYNTDMQWDAEVKQSIVQTMATDADSGVEGTISYSLVEGNSRGFFKIDNNGVLMLAYKLDSSIGTDATEIVTLTVKAMDGGIIPKYSSVQIIIRISGNNPGACIQGTEHSKQVLDITEERNNWSYAMYALVALLCIAIVCSLFFLYKWRTTPVPTISHPVDKDGKNKYLSSGSDYSDLGKRNTVEYSHSNQGFDPLSMLNPDPYSTVCDNDLHVATSI